MSAPISTSEQRAARRVGTVLCSKYALQRLLGVGGMAAVYLGVHRNGNRVAVKVLHPEASAHPDTRARFLREGYVANSIEHPGAVRVLDDDQAEDGAAFLVMELLEGETLAARCKREGGRLPAREVLALARELCDVLAAAHEKGVVHRDVKPDNLFLTTDRVLKVLDFGIARSPEGSVDNATLAGAALGTPAFMAPEQALGRHHDVDARSDVWSVGATMFVLLSGQLVHEGETQGELLAAAATLPARSLAAAAPDVPASIVALVDRALRFSRDLRWPSARALREGIEEAHLAAFGAPVSLDAVGPVPAPPPALSMPAAELFFAVTQPVVEPSSSSHESASTLPAGSGAFPTRVTVSYRPSAPGPSVPLPASVPPAPPSQRGGAVLAVALAMVVGVMLLVTRVRHGGSDGTLPPAGEAPCFADQDCGGHGWACGPAGRCVELRAAEPSPAPHPGCTENSACIAANEGRPSICRHGDGACVALESEDCKVLAEPGDRTAADTVWIGAMFPLSGPDALVDGNASRDSVDLARRDLAETVGGLPPARPGGPRRPLAVVMCDDAKDPARAAAHLVDDVRVPVILGFHRSKEVADLAASLFNPRGVLALAANTASMLRTIPREPGGARLVWRTTTSTDMVSGAIAALLAGVVEPELRAAPGVLATGEPFRVVLPRLANATGLGEADGLVAALRFNGKSVAENGESFRQIVFSDTPDEAQVRQEAERVAAEIAAFRPHAILDDMGGALITAVERAWPSGARFRPRYLRVDITSPDVLDLVRQHPEARRRLYSADTVTTTPVVAKFVLRHNEVFPTKITATTATGAPYDAFYLAAYAIAALGGDPITGPALARAIPRLLPPGEPIDVGPAGIYQALAALAEGRSVDLQGTTTSLDFDPETGDGTADFAIFCFAPARDGGAPEAVESGLVLRARTGKLEGTLRCP